MASDDDIDFKALMRGQGVAPVRGAREGGAGRGAKSGAKVRVEGREVKPPAQARAGAVAPLRAQGRGVTAEVVPVRAQGRAVKAVEPGKLAVGARELAAERAVELVRAELLAVRAELEGQRRERERLALERDGLVVSLAGERDVVARLQAELAAVRRRAESAARPLEVPRISLAAALGERGLRDGEEQTRAVALLMGTESAARVLAALETRDIDGLRSALERRLALVCGSRDCRELAGETRIEVEPARCELCGGSEIHRAAGRFARACEAAGIARVRFVGGSPNYRTQLEALFPERGALTVRTTEGDRRVSLSRSKAQQRKDDLVVIWGATELDHATSGAYRAQFGRVEVIAHRGIGRMLDLAAERITTG